jgi:mono/diheme cytochrome c family protein
MMAFAVLATAFCGSASTATPERGAELVEKHCGKCHAVGRQGQSPEPAAPAFRELHRRYDPEQLSEALAEGLLTGHPLMPEFRFEADDVRSIILYLKSIQTRQAG